MTPASCVSSIVGSRVVSRIGTLTSACNSILKVAAVGVWNVKVKLQKFGRSSKFFRLGLARGATLNIRCKPPVSHAVWPMLSTLGKINMTSIPKFSINICDLRWIQRSPECHTNNQFYLFSNGYLTGLSTSHPFKFSISSGSSSIKFLPLPSLLPVLRPVPVRGGNGGLSSKLSTRFSL
jgi:hypothetical protein